MYVQQCTHTHMQCIKPILYGLFAECVFVMFTHAEN